MRKKYINYRKPRLHWERFNTTISKNHNITGLDIGYLKCNLKKFKYKNLNK